MGDRNGFVKYNIWNALARHIEPIFKDGVKLTLIARTPGNNEADVLVSAEGDLQDVMDLIARSMSRNVIGHPEAIDGVPRNSETSHPPEQQGNNTERTSHE